MKKIYLIFTIIGFILPYSLLIPWLLEYGLNIEFFLQELFENRIAGAFGIDVIISAIVVILFIVIEGKKLQMTKLWIPILGILVVGVSFGLPLFLYMREDSVKETI